MTITAKLNYLRIAPRKVRLVADLIRGKQVPEAQAILNFTTKKATGPILKLLNSALANAKNTYQLESAGLCISEIKVNEGPKYKRWRSMSRGQAYEIQKKTSHIVLVLSETKGEGKKAKKTKKIKETPEVKKIPGEEKIEKITKPEEKPKLRPERELLRPKAERGLKRIFKRKAF